MAESNGKRKRKPRAEKKPRERKAKVAKAEKAKDATAGLNKKPKNKILFLNTEGALALVRKSLKCLTLSDLSEEERFEFDRLNARIDARI